MNTLQAAEMLHMSRGAVNTLLHRGQLAGTKVGNRWVITQDAVDEYNATRRPPGRPPKPVAVFTLMNGPYEVARFAFDDSDDQGGFDFLEIIDTDRAPLYCLLPDSFGRGEFRFTDWWFSRGIPATREGIQRILEPLGIISASELTFKNYALSLSDQYWLKPDGDSAQWEDINYFDNDFADSDIAQNRPVNWESFAGTNSPSNILNGMEPKKWVIQDGVRTLLKGYIKGYTQQPSNEAIATALYRRLLPEPDYVPYDLVVNDHSMFSSCPLFLSRNEEYIPAWMCMKDVRIQGDEYRDGYERFIAHAVRVGVNEDEVRLFLSKMIVCDYILANSDRHMGNFGFIRNIDTLDMRMAPLFDAGNSLWFGSPDAMLERMGYTWEPEPFDKVPRNQLAYVKDWEWLDFSKLEDFGEEAEEILIKGLQGEPRSKLIREGLERNLTRLDAYLNM